MFSVWSVIARFSSPTKGIQPEDQSQASIGLSYFKPSCYPYLVSFVIFERQLYLHLLCE